MPDDCQEPRGAQLIESYKKNFSISAEAEVGEEMILRHWDLERALRDELLASNPEDRQEVFEACYGRLKRELAWLDKLTGANEAEPPEVRFADWLALIGQPDEPGEAGGAPARICELVVNRGGELSGLLAGHGFDCTAAEIMAGRSGKMRQERPNLRQVASDGTHLDHTVEPESFDFVLADQVIERLHPDDLDEHLSSVAAILRPGGRYILGTPHAFTGPVDVSAVFGCRQPHGIHLREYRYIDLTIALETAGLKRILAPMRFPGGRRPPKAGSFYLNYQIGLEALLGLLPAGHLRRRATRVARYLYFNPFILLVAVKGE